MGKTKRTYDETFKKKAIDLYFKEGMGYTRIGKELGIDEKNVRRWVKRFKEEGIKGLEEKRGKATGGKKGRPRNCPKEPTERIKYLETENEMLKKLLGMLKEG
ncbi:helix-turn-helix domain-containing protein [Bacillus hominis]|uniref:Helix-turn-helix domain-containing protein n=1 Tax=Bacillus hominis TaxID=2817478 RepID=A0ABT7RA86_9BACI|nr:helix-turn-helix domain-containing protein [Bacillus hominis]MDM5439837.1 helix-turn-helix domain-containing protein [Bacillus hominis]